MRGAEQREVWRGRKRSKRLVKRGGKAVHADEYRRTAWGELRSRSSELRRGSGRRGKQ